MATGYTRQSSSVIVTNGTINASDFNNEYNLLQTFADNTQGHDHSGSTTGVGAPIPNVGLQATQNWSNTGGANNPKTFTIQNGTYLNIVDPTDNTKTLRFSTSGFTTGVTNTWTFQNTSDTLVGLATTDTLTNKTLTAPTILTIVSGSGTLTLPTNTTDTLVARNTTDTLTNKTLTSPTINTATIASASIGSSTLANTNTYITLDGTKFIIQNQSDTTKQVAFSASLLTTGNTRTFSFPDITDTLTTNTATQTLTNKTLTSPLITGATISGTATGAYDASFFVVNSSDTTKQARFDCSQITTGTIRTYQFPNVSDQITTNTATQTLTNKTITAPTITSIANLGNGAFNDANGNLGSLLHGQCRFIYVSTTQVVLNPYNGCFIQIAGIIYAIPSTGVTANYNTAYINGVANQTLGASTLYYVYVFNNSGNLALDFSTTGYSTDNTAGNVGVMIKTGNNSRTLVGMVYTNTNSQFMGNPNTSNLANFNCVSSWFNRRPLNSASFPGTGYSTTSPSFVELSTNLRCYFLLWANDNALWMGATGYASPASAPVTATFAVWLDGGGAASQQAIGMTVSTNFPITASELSGPPGEGLHYLTPVGTSSNASIAVDYTVWPQVTFMG